MRPVAVGILSIGDMGLGIARLLQANGYRVLTVAAGRSEDTLARIRSASVEALQSDQQFVVESDYILSIVPPRDALATAHRIVSAYRLPDTTEKRAALGVPEGVIARPKLYYLDCNAIPARLARDVKSLFSGSGVSEDGALCYFLDGGIIGGPPIQDPQTGTWKKPSFVVSGSVDLPPSFDSLAETLNLKIISPKIGAASTLKLSFAALTKGLTALSILSFSTAETESVLPDLLEHLRTYSPSTAALAVRGVTGMPPKAYRWVDEMRGIGEALDVEGHWQGLGNNVYGAFAEIYRIVAEDTVLGEEKVGKRDQGRTVEEVAQILAGAIGSKKPKRILPLEEINS